MTTILLVHENAASVESDAETAKSLGYAVLTAGTIESAVEFACSSQGVDLLLIGLDHGLALDGVQAARHILCFRELPVLFLSASPEKEIVEKARAIPRAGLVTRTSGKFVLQHSLELALELFAERQRLLQGPSAPQAAGAPGLENRPSLPGPGDLTPCEQVEQALRESEERLHQIASALHEVIWLRDVKTRQVLYVNPAFEILTGLPCEEFYQNPDAFINLIHPADQPRIGRGNVFRSDVHRILRPDGGIRWVWGRTFPVLNEAGEIYRTAAIVEDITERKQAEENLSQANERLLAQMEEIQQLQATLSEQVLRDPLTGLYNRRYLADSLERELVRAQREGYPVSLLMMDIDNFKQINDTYGHTAGDEVLKNLAFQLDSLTRVSDLACRMGGDEFLLVFSNATAAVAFQRAELHRCSFQESGVVYQQTKIFTTLSVGIAVFPEQGSTAQELLGAADRALYKAKANGRNRVEG